jgi:hypothetical protein
LLPLEETVVLQEMAEMVEWVEQILQAVLVSWVVTVVPVLLQPREELRVEVPE